MTMNVSDLTDEWLDYWVAKALGYSVERANIGPGWIVATAGGARVTSLPLNNPMHWSPSQDWAQGGPLIELERIALMYHEDQPYGGPWLAAILNGRDLYSPEVGKPDGEGPTPLIAAMRAFVASKFGEELPISSRS